MDTGDLPPAALTLLETAEHIVGHLRGREKVVSLKQALDLLRAALVADQLRATGEIDATPRREIDPADWRDLTFDFGEPGPVIGFDYIGVSSLPLEPMVRSVSGYPGKAVMDHSAPTRWMVPSDEPGGVASYHRVVRNVRLRRADTERRWPLTHPRTMGTAAAATKARDWMIELMTRPDQAPVRNDDLQRQAQSKFHGLSARAFALAKKEAIQATGANHWSRAGRPKESSRP